MTALMAQTGKNKGNKNAALKPGEIGRIQFTVSLSGESLKRFIHSLNIDPSMISQQELREQVAAAAREKIQNVLDEM